MMMTEMSTPQSVGAIVELGKDVQSVATALVLQVWRPFVPFVTY